MRPIEFIPRVASPSNNPICTTAAREYQLLAGRIGQLLYVTQLIALSFHWLPITDFSVAVAPRRAGRRLGE